MCWRHMTLLSECTHSSRCCHRYRIQGPSPWHSPSFQCTYRKMCHPFDQCTLRCLCNYPGYTNLTKSNIKTNKMFKGLKSPGSSWFIIHSWYPSVWSKNVDLFINIFLLQVRKICIGNNVYRVAKLKSICFCGTECCSNIVSYVKLTAAGKGGGGGGLLEVVRILKPIKRIQP